MKMGRKRSMDPHERSKTELEANTLRMFSVFFLVLAVMVLLGSYWAADKTSTLIISLASGSALLVVAGLASCFARVVRRRLLDR
jgi:membrane protein YdbS with pleckstrin-like domain